MAYKIFNPQEIDFDFTYDGPYDIINGDKKKKKIYIRNDESPLLIQLPSLLLSEDYIDGSGGVILPLMTKDSSQNEELKNFLTTLDRKVLETIRLNLKSWNLKFTKPSYRAIVRVIENNSENVYMNGVIRLDFTDGITKIFDHEKNIIPENKYRNVLTKGCYLKSIIEVVGIVIEENVISIEIITHQIGVSYQLPKQIILSEYSFIDTDDEEENVLEPEIDNNMTQLFDTLNEESSNNMLSDKHDNSESSNELGMLNDTTM